MRGSRESLLYRESALRALNREKNKAKGSWKGMTPEEAYKGLLEEVLELGEELFADYENPDMLDHLYQAMKHARTAKCREREDLRPQRIQQEYDDIGGAHLILGDVAGCLKPTSVSADDEVIRSAVKSARHELFSDRQTEGQAPSPEEVRARRLPTSGKES